MYHMSHVETKPSADVVVVPREEWACMLDLVLCLLIDEDAYDKTEKFLGPIERSRKERDGNGWIGIMADELDALRSSTNHEKKETLAVRCVDCANWTGCPNLAARNHRKGCAEFERGGEASHDAQDAGDGR